MAGIFISYRREDAAADAGRLFDDLQRRCLKDQVFLDLSIGAGQKFPELLSEKLRDCDVLLALIGPRWLDLKNDTGQRRLEDEQDFVRFEIASALAMHKLVVPVLLPGAKMPGPAELPESIGELACRNAFELRHNRWATDLNLLIQQLPHNLRCGEEVSMTLSWKSWVYLLLVPTMMLTLVHVFAIFNLAFDPQFMLMGLSSMLGIVHSIRFRFGWFERLLIGVVISVATGLLASVIVPVLSQQDILPQSWAEIRSFAAFVSGLLAGYLAGSLLVSIFLPRGSGSRNPYVDS